MRVKWPGRIAGRLLFVDAISPSFSAFVLPVGVLLVLLAVYAARPAFVISLQNNLVDQYNRWHPRENINDAVILAEVDEGSLQRLGQFPWPRNMFAELIDRMNKAGAAAIAMDVLFAEPDRTGPASILPNWQRLDRSLSPAEWQTLQQQMNRIDDPDSQLAASIAAAPTVLAVVLDPSGQTLPPPIGGFALHKPPPMEGVDGLDEPDPLRLLPRIDSGVANLEILQQGATGFGSINARIDPDGIIRSTALLLRSREHIYPALSIETLRVAQNAGGFTVKAAGLSDEFFASDAMGISKIKTGSFMAPVQGNGTFRLYYTGPENIRRIPAWQILEADFDPLQVAGKIVYFGATAAGLKELRSTPLNPAADGVEIHVQTTQQIIDGVFLKRPFTIWILEAILAMMFSGFLIAGVRSVGPVLTMTTWLVFGGGLAYASWLGFTHYQYLTDPVGPILISGLVMLTAGMTKYLKIESDRRLVRTAFRQYLPPKLVEQIARNPDDLQLGGSIRPMTIMFSDIRGFTHLSETLRESPDRLTSIINRFFTVMTHHVHARNGTIDKYIGDCIMAFWNAPHDVEQHPKQACLAALDMRTALLQLNEELSHDTQNWSDSRNIVQIGLDMGIGLNTGDALVGNVGSEQRFNYSAMGDAVNIAARLESQSKIYGLAILVGQQTYDRTSELAYLQIDRVALVGKGQPENIYALMGDEIMAQSPAFKQIKQQYDDMLSAYRRCDWERAETLLSAIATNEPKLAQSCQLFKDRIADYKINPPPADWDGRYLAQTK